MNHGVAPRRSLASKTLAMALLLMLVGAWLAPVAHAQVGVIGDIGGAVGDVGDAIGGGGDTGGGGGGGSDSGGGLVGGITDGLEGGTKDSGSENEGSGGPIDGVIDAVDNAVADTKDQVKETANDAGGSLAQVGSGAGGTVDTVKDTLDRTTDGLTGTGGHKKKAEEHARSPHRRAGSTAPSSVGTGTEVLGASMADALRADSMILAAAKTEDNDYAVTGSSSADQSFIAQIGRVATEAAQQAAFPIALILMVAAFLMVQNRIDSKDPKLALAPVDSEHDLLSFT